MTAHPAIAAVPTNAQPNRALLQAALILNCAYIMPDADDPQVFDPRGFGGTPRTIVIGWQSKWFFLDDADGTTAHDGTTCIVTADAKRYKVYGVDLLITAVISHTLTAQPVSPAIGDSYRIPVGATGADWASKPKYIGTYTARGWEFIAPKVGWTVWTKGSGATRDQAYHYDSIAGDWIAGLGATPFTADSIPLSACIWAGASAVVKVENQTTYAPPGSRKTGATPTMPLGGTAANINDNSEATTAVTGAIGDKTAASVANRIVAQLALAAATDLIAIEVRDVLGSAASTALAMGLYYSTDGVAWTQAGAGFSLTTSAQDVIRTGTFTAVTHVALVTEDKNWAANTHTLADLNAYDATVDAAVGDAYIIAANAFGIFAGHETKIAICEAEDTFTIYTQVIGDEVYDKALGIVVGWNGSIWNSVSGVWIDEDFVETTGSGSTSDNHATVAACYSYSAVSGPTTSSRHISDDAGLAFTAKSAASGLKFKYQVQASYTASGGAPSGGQQFNIGLFRDSETTAIAWKPLAVTDSTIGADVLINLLQHVEVEFPRVTAGDTSAHTYKVKLFSGHDGAGNYRTISALQVRSLSVEERAA